MFRDFNLYQQIQDAERGDAQAQWKVGYYLVFYNKKEPISRDEAELAVGYFRQAALQGHCDAMLDLGAMFFSGRGVDKDMRQAAMWYSKAADMLHPKAFRCLANTLQIPFASGYMDPPVDGADYKKAFEYYLKGALLKEQNSLYALGDLFFGGKYVPQDEDFAFLLYQESVSISSHSIGDDSYADACLRLGDCYLHGIGCSRDFVKARLHLKEAIASFEFRLSFSDEEYITGGLNRARFLLGRLDEGKDLSQGFKLESQHLSQAGGAGASMTSEEQAFIQLAKQAFFHHQQQTEALNALAEYFQQARLMEQDLRFAAFLRRKAQEVSQGNGG